VSTGWPFGAVAVSSRLPAGSKANSSRASGLPWAGYLREEIYRQL
jgi:hypothetical protein